MLKGRKFFISLTLLIAGLGFIGHWLDPDTIYLRTVIRASGFKINGQIFNRSSKPLWVIEGSHNSVHAYLLEPHHKSPDTLDADAVRSFDGAPIQSDTAWYKILDGSKAEVVDLKGSLQINCLACYPLYKHEFDPIIFNPAKGWGQPL